MRFSFRIQDMFLTTQLVLRRCPTESHFLDTSKRILLFLPLSSIQVCLGKQRFQETCPRSLEQNERSLLAKFLRFHNRKRKDIHFFSWIDLRITLRASGRTQLDSVIMLLHCCVPVLKALEKGSPPGAQYSGALLAPQAREQARVVLWLLVSA